MMWTKSRLEDKKNRSGEGNAESGHGTSRWSQKHSKASTVGPEGSSTHALSEEWMSYLDDETPLSALTIPGTHDSAAFTYSWPFISTQNLDIRDQLNAGIRYFDLRCGIRHDVVEMVHGPTYLGLRLDKVLDTMYIWLAAHPTEALLVQIKRDRGEDRSEVQFAQAIFQVISQKSERWRTANTMTSLGKMRGRVQLFRRFEGPNLDAYGMDVSEWEDNPTRPFTIYTRHGVQIMIQDHYNFPDPETLPSLITKKGGDVSELLEHASCNKDESHWYINFVSAYEFNLYYQLTPREVAVGGWWGFTWVDGMNVRLRSYLRESERRKKRFGVVAMDFPETGTDDLVAALIRSNFTKDEKPKRKAFMVWIRFILLISMFFACVWVMNGRQGVFQRQPRIHPAQVEGVGSANRPCEGILCAL